jgi:hypothetical protein
MSKKPAKQAKMKDIVCKGKGGCGYSFKPVDVKTNKEWTLVSPMPDKNGQVTITIMATWNCPECGKSITGALGKTKGDLDGPSKKELLQQALDSGEAFELEDLAKKMGYQVENIEKMVQLMIKKNLAKGKVEGGKFIPQ